MTQQTETTRYRFDAAIIGKEIRGQKVMVKLDWKLPSAKYELNLYLDPEDAESLDVGDHLNWSITRGGLGKARDGSAKTGQYPTDYFWDWDKDDSATKRTTPTVNDAQPYDESGAEHWKNCLAACTGVQCGCPCHEAERSMNEDFAPTQTRPGLAPGGYPVPFDPDSPTAGQHGNPRDTEPESTEKPNAGIEVQGIVQGHLEKLAVDLYRTECALLHASSTASDAGSDIDYLRIREIRDNFFHQVKEKPIQHEHFCYEHEAQMQKGNTGYGHKVEGGWCIEDRGIIMDEGE